MPEDNGNSTPEEVAETPRYILLEWAPAWDEYRVQDTRTGAKSDMIRSQSYITQWLQMLNSGGKHFHNLAWILPNGTYIRSRGMTV